MSVHDFLRDLRRTLELGAGASSLLLMVVPGDQDVEDASGMVLALLRNAGHNVCALPDSAQSGEGTAEGPLHWLRESRKRPAQAYVAVMRSAGMLAEADARAFNGQRDSLRDLDGPLLLFVSDRNEDVLRRHAADFYVVARPRPVPSLWELRSLLAVDAPWLAPKTSAAVIPPIRFLHVSDLHLAPSDRHDEDRVQRGLIKLLRSGPAGALDFICLTGDLARRGQEAEYRLVVHWIDELLDATQVQKRHLFVVPGNHDVDRARGRFLLRSIAPLKEDYTRPERVEAQGLADAFFTASRQERARWHGDKFADYATTLGAYLGSGRPLGLQTGALAIETLQVRGEEIAIASLNSAWFAQRDDDERQLWLGEANIGPAAEHVDLLRRDRAVRVALALFHHPTEWLHPLDRRPVEQHLERSFDIVLRGHLHEAQATGRSTPRSGYVEAAAAAAYQGSPWGNGCFIGEIRAEERTLTLTAYRYVSGADPWVVDASAFPPAGQFEVRWPKKPRPLTRDAERQLRSAYWALDGTARDRIVRSLGLKLGDNAGRLRAHEDAYDQLQRSGRLVDLWETLRRER